MKPDKKIIQQQTELYFNNHKKWYFENLEALEYKEQFIVQEIDRTDSAIKDLEKHLQNPDLRSDDNISYLQGGYKYLEFLKKEYQKHLPPQQTETKTGKLKVPQIALIHVYEGIQITRENAGEIAAKHGYTAKNSGEGLFQDYTNYCSTANRKGKPTPCTPKKLKNKIELFESVVNHLSDNNKQRANDEINILKTIFENEYQ